MGLFKSIGQFFFGGQRKGNESKTSSNPWGPTVEPLKQYLGDTQSLYKNTPMFGEMEMDGINRVKGAVGQNQGMIDTAIGQNNDTMSGKYLTPDTNPYLADIARRISGMAGAQSQAMFGSSGRTGSGLAGYHGGKAVTDSLTDLFGSVYQQERGFQENAKQMVPGLVGVNTGNAGTLYDLGREINERPLERNAQYGGILRSIAGLGGDTTSTEYKQTRGLFGDILNAGVNAFFDTKRPTG